MSFSGKVVIVTGASSGIGAATALAFTKEGADVALVARNEAKLNKVAAECAKHGKQPLIITADVTIDEDVKTIVNKTVQHFAKIDVLINNAGIFRFVPLKDERILETFDEVMNTNLRAIVHLTSVAVPHLVKTKGNIINISSISGSAVVVPECVSYAVSKAGLDHFTRCIALEFAPDGVRVNGVSPGPVVSDIFANAEFSADYCQNLWERLKARTALNRISDAEEIADLILFLASGKARGITGSLFVSDNGTLMNS